LPWPKGPRILAIRGSALPSPTYLRPPKRGLRVGGSGFAQAGLNLSPLARPLLRDQRLPLIAALVFITGKEMLTDFIYHLIFFQIIYYDLLIGFNKTSPPFGESELSWRSFEMDQEKLLYFKGLLEGRLHDLVEEAGKTCSDMRQENDGDFPDPTDRASWDLWHLRILRKAHLGKETDGQTGHHFVHRM
jgi:hypothetical protein